MAGDEHRGRHPPTDVAQDHDRPARIAVDDGAKGQREEGERKDLHCAEHADVERHGVVQQDRQGRHGQHGHLGAQLAGALAEPEQIEVASEAELQTGTSVSRADLSADACPRAVGWVSGL